MKQKVYFAVIKQFCGNKEEGAWIISTHYNQLDAEMAAYAKYFEMEKHERCAYSEWSDFGGFRGLVRYNTGHSWSIYTKEQEVEL